MSWAGKPYPHELIPMVIPISAVIVGDRGRKFYGNLDGLSSSLATLGSIHPIVLGHNEDGTYELIAGGRRLAASKSMKVTELHHGSILEPGKIGFLFKDEVPKDIQKEAELDENLYRLGTKWHEDVLVISDIHEIKRSTNLKWGQRQTSALLGEGYGLTKVTHAIRLAKLIRAGDEQILNCATMSDAISVMVKRKEDEALAELHRRVMPSGADMSGFLDSLSIPLGGPKHDPMVGKTEMEGGLAGALKTLLEVKSEGSTPSSPATSTEPINVPLSKMFMHGDCLKIMENMPDGCVGHVMTDIPYGIDMDNLDTIKAIQDVAAEHDVSDNVNMMEPFLVQAYRLTQSGGFCVFFYDLDWHEYLQATAEKIGWKVQRWPLIAHKTSACQNNAAQYNFTKNYEAVMVLRRDEKTVLRKQQPSSVWTGDFAAERALYNNPFAKPFLLWKWLFDAISFPGQSFLDPFCGEMSSCRAGVNCGLTPFGIEINEKHYLRGLENMKAVYALLYKSNVTFS